MDNLAKQSLLETRTADKLHIGADHFLQLAHFRKNTLTITNQEQKITIRRHRVHKLKNEETAKRYRESLNCKWDFVKEIEYSSTEDRYRDYCWVISQAAL